MNLDQRINLQVETPKVQIAGISDPGRSRSENQDYIFLDKKGKFVLLADGMGGHERGSEASKTALETIQEYFKPEVIESELCDITEGSGVPAEVVCFESLVDTAVDAANRLIFNRNKELNLKRFMGTTLVGMTLVDPSYTLWFHVGDSRLYRWRDAELNCLTSDHSAYKEWIRDGKEGEEPSKNIITRAIGPNEMVVVETMWEEHKKGDMFILCSDGLTDMITDGELEEILASENRVDLIAEKLIDAANEAGGKDNASVIVCRIL